MQPLHDNILVKPFPPDDISAGGIVVPDSFKVRPDRASVVAVGSKVKNGIQLGDTVFHVKHAGTEMVIDGEKLYLMKSTDVLARML